MAMPIHLLINYGCFLATMVVMTDTIWPEKTTELIIWPSLGKAC